MKRYLNGPKSINEIGSVISNFVAQTAKCLDGINKKV